MAELIIPTPLRKYTNNEATFKTDEVTVGDAIEALVNNYPDLKKHLLDDNGDVRSFINIFVGDDDIRALDKTNTHIKDDTVVSIVPAIAGGIS